MLDHPAFPRDRLVGVGYFIGVQHQVDGGVPNRMGGHPPSQPVQLANHAKVAFPRHGLETHIAPTLAPWLAVGLSHPATLEPTVHAQLHTGDPKPLVALTRRDAVGVEGPGEVLGFGRVRRAQQHADTKRKRITVSQGLQMSQECR